MEKKWYAVYTKARHEKKIAQQLGKKGFENYCPLNRVQRQWHDRKKIIYEPLFTSYVFVRVEERFLSEIRQLEGIINFVYWLKKPVIIKNEEIDSIKKFLDDYENVRLEKVMVNVDDKVKILNGAFMNEVGNVISIKNKYVRVALPSLGYQMVAEIKIQNIQIVGSQRESVQFSSENLKKAEGVQNLRV